MTVKALVFSSEQGLRLEEREELKQGSEALVRVRSVQHGELFFNHVILAPT